MKIVMSLRMKERKIGPIGYNFTSAIRVRIKYTPFYKDIVLFDKDGYKDVGNVYQGISYYRVKSEWINHILKNKGEDGIQAMIESFAVNKLISLREDNQIKDKLDSQLSEIRREAKDKVEVHMSLSDFLNI